MSFWTSCQVLEKQGHIPEKAILTEQFKQIKMLTDVLSRCTKEEDKDGYNSTYKNPL